MASSKKFPLTGPRGGVTTVSCHGLLKKAMYLYQDQWETLRLAAYKKNRPASDIVREALTVYFEARKAEKAAKRTPPPAPPAEDHGSM